jgi:hypothetical protein
MRENKSKGKSVKASGKKHTSKRARSRTPAQLKKDAARILDIMNSAEVSSHIRYEIGVLIIEEIDGANIIEQHKELFVQAYAFAARQPDGDISELERILTGLDAGEQLADAVVMREARQPQIARPTSVGPDIAKMLSAVLKHPKLPHELHESIFEALVDLQNEAGARAITESETGIRATLEIYEQRGDGGDDTTDLQPRNKREQAIIENVLEHAEEIRAARARTDARAIAISPHYSERERSAARERLQAGQQHTPINMRPISEDDARRIADELTNIGIDDHDRKSLITLICGIAVIDSPIRRQEVAEAAVCAIYQNLDSLFDEVARFVAGIYAEEDEQKGGQG